MTYLYRCSRSNCRQRRALLHHHTWYIRKPKCKACNRLLEHPDYWQMKKNKEDVCKCDAYPFPHRSGSSVMCTSSKVEPTQKQINEWHEQQRGVQP